MPHGLFHELGRPWLLVARSDPFGISLALLDEAREVAQLPFVLDDLFSVPSAFVFADIGGFILKYGGTYS